jgi:hypothetical protein
MHDTERSASPVIACKMRFRSDSGLLSYLSRLSRAYEPGREGRVALVIRGRIAMIIQSAFITGYREGNGLIFGLRRVDVVDLRMESVFLFSCNGFTDCSSQIPFAGLCIYQCVDFADVMK